MANEIKDKLGASTVLISTGLDALPSSTAGAGKQTNFVDNTTTRWGTIIFYYDIVQGTSPTGGKLVYFHFLRKDNNATPHRDDNAGEAEANHTVVNSYPYEIGKNKASPATGEHIMGSFVVEKPGPGFALSINHNTEVNLGTGSYVRWLGINPEIQ